MQAIILAGGKGKRLHSVTEDLIPKPLVQVHTSVLLDYIIEHAKNNGCDDIIICVGHLGHKIQEHVNKNNYGIPITISQEQESLGTAGALDLIKAKLEDEFFILYGDVYTTINLQSMYTFHKQKEADVTLALHVSDHPQDSTVVTSDKSGRIKKFVEKPGDNWQKYGGVTTTPLYIVKKDVINFIPSGIERDFAKDIFPQMLNESKRIYGYLTEEYAKDMGTPERYKKVLELLKK
jgi:NDP-sugar pyrophosphorylase family protein